MSREEKLNASNRERQLFEARKKRRKNRLAAVAGTVAFTIFFLAAVALGTWKVVELVTGNTILSGNKNVVTTMNSNVINPENVNAGPEDEILREALSKGVVFSQEDVDERIKQAIASAKEEEAARVLEGIKDSFAQGNTTIETLRPLYPDDIVLASSGSIRFIPINRELKQSTLKQENLNILETGEYQYLQDGQVISHKGIDVSSHQGDINWNQVAEDGVEFAIIRVGFRGYGKEGKLVQDEKFEKNIKGAIDAGIKVGVYFFSQAINDEELQEEARMVLDSIAPYQIDCPIVYDVEKVSGNGRMNNISVEERTRLTLKFLEIIENNGYQPMIYHNTEMAALMIDIAAFEKYEKWYASYNQTMFYPYEYKIWQYSEKGKVKGIKGDVDLNICFAPIWSEG